MVSTVDFRETSTSPDVSTSQKREFHEKRQIGGDGKQTTHEPSGLSALLVRCESPCCVPSLVAIDFLALAGLFESEVRFGGLDGADWVDIPALSLGLGECLGIVIYNQGGC